ncbi:rho guanine nucleotide exchange factor 7-like isoform X3 [Convolutriloba macropyga]|uniref:rho guanine nucleotide exchange factor 7-like isoform X3 n=1 Tax=Convolutriloba macropyga TaxID=536237 RepID=UPI003F5225BF
MSAPQSVPPVPFTAKALYNFVGNHEDELQFKKGDCLTVLQVVDGGWWEGQLQIPGAQQGTGPIGWFPANHIKVVASDVTAKEPSPLSALHSHSESSSSNKQATDTPKASHKTSHYSLGLYSLLESQIRFEECLNNLLEKSLIPLGNSNILSAKDYDILCCNLHEITQLVKSLTKELTEACRVASNSREQQKFGRQYCSFITRYRQLLLVYCANHPAAVRVISNHSSQLDSFAKASRSSLGSASPSQSTNSGATTTTTGAAGGYTGTILDLTAAFSQPFRQVETYSAILREIKASVSDSHPDYNQITEAIRMSDNLVNELEEIRGLKEKELEMLSARIDNWPLSMPPFTPTGGNHDQGTIAQLSTLGPLIQMAPVWTYKPSNQGGGLTESYILMFNDYVVILEHTFDPRCYKCQHLIEMHELVAHAKDSSSSEQKANPSSPKYPLVLIDREGERYQVLFKLNQLRAFWVKLIGDQSSQAMRGGTVSAGAAVPGYPHSKGGHHHQGASHQFSGGASGRLRASTATSASSSVSPQPSASHHHQHHSQGVSRPPPFMRTERTMPGMGGSGSAGGSGGNGSRSTNAVTTGGFDITQLRPNPPMTPSELILCSRHSSDSVKSPKVSRKKSNRKSEKIRAEELAELNSRKSLLHGCCPALDCRSLDHDAKIFEVIEAYCQSSQNRMTLHSGYVSLPMVKEKMARNSPELLM